MVQMELLIHDPTHGDLVECLDLHSIRSLQLGAFHLERLGFDFIFVDIPAMDIYGLHLDQ